MERTTKRYTLKRTQARNGGLLLIGIGLLLLGIVSGIFLLGSDNERNLVGATEGNRSSDGSVVPVEVNFKAPNLRLTDIDGNEVSIRDHRGKVILINNWATWCPPCKAEMPALEAFYDAHKAEGFVLIAIDAGESSADVLDFVKSYNLSFPVWLDPDNQSLQTFKNFGLPNSYVIDENGDVRLAWTGAINDTMLEKYVTPLLKD